MTDLYVSFAICVTAGNFILSTDYSIHFCEPNSVVLRFNVQNFMLLLLTLINIFLTFFRKHFLGLLLVICLSICILSYALKNVSVY